MIKGEILGSAALVSRFEGMAPRFTGLMTKSISRLVLTLMRNVKADKLSGQVLNVRSGRLRRSINQRIEGAGTEMVAGYVGTNVVYGKPHEFGFKGNVQVKQHMRTIKTAFGKSISPVQITVHGYTRKMDAPARSFLRSALAEMDGEIRAEIRGAVTEAIK
jgi:phage gpG-like protein